jgi:small-conductance mechanosensitive channel
METVMSEYLQMIVPFAREVVTVVAILIVALVCSSVLRRLIDRQREAKRVGATMAGRLQKIRQSVIVVLTVLVLMEALGVFGSAWALISTALAALAVGFVAAWSVLSNATAALLVLTFRPFRLGDSVELVEPGGSAIGGRVIDMNLMYTTLSVEPDSTGPSALEDKESVQTPQFLRIPNNLFFQKILRTRSLHSWDSKATFFSHEDN